MNVFVATLFVMTGINLLVFAHTKESAPLGWAVVTGTFACAYYFF